MKPRVKAVKPEAEKHRRCAGEHRQSEYKAQSQRSCRNTSSLNAVPPNTGLQDAAHLPARKPSTTKKALPKERFSLHE